MNSTSPGQVHSLVYEEPDSKIPFSNVATICYNNKNNHDDIYRKTDTETTINALLPKVIQNHNSIDVDRLYDDPCELLDDDWNRSNFGQLPKSRSWLCCPQNTEKRTVFLENESFFDRKLSSENMQLVTEAPKPMSCIVGVFFILIT